LPVVSELGVLFSLTLLVNGPYGALLPVAQEPIVMVFARLYPPTVVAAVATLSATTVEYVNYRLFDAAVHSRVLSGARRSRQMQSVVRWFDWQPFPTVAFCALTPIPFVLARIVAVAAHYPVSRFLAANAIGRFPRFWAYGALGVLIPVSTRDLLIGGTVLTAVLGLAVWVRRVRGVARARQHAIRGGQSASS
jgi:membrane protein YqaA with SNARE-associated domain